MRMAYLLLSNRASGLVDDSRDQPVNGVSAAGARLGLNMMSILE
jgi:hypothetical protein